MDAPGETQLLEVTSDARHARNTLPELSSSQSTPDCPSPTRSLAKRKSLRARPTDLLEQQHATPPLPLRTRASQPELRRPPSKMSLFSLFSKPKVEKLRGFTEDGLDSPPRSLSHSVARSSRKGSVQDEDAEKTSTRPTTSKSPSTRRRIAPQPIPPLPPLPQIPANHRAFGQLPLFQAWPQALRHGIFEASMISPEVVLQKNRHKMPGSTPNLGDGAHEDGPSNKAGTESRGTVMTAFRSGSMAPRSEDTAKKIFILVTSGYLLQYAQTGPSDRMPEKTLKLGRDSAAYASDLISGKHHVLQVSQAVDTQGALVQSSQSIFSKFSLRSHAPRRTTSNFLIVMPGAQELGEWLTAIRQEIQKQGGKMARSDSPTERRPETGEPGKLDLQNNPSQSHRYLVKRDPSKVLSVISPLGDTFSWFPSPLESPAEEAIDLASAEGVSPKGDDSASIRSRPRAPSDSPSVSSSTGQSVDQQQLDKLRDSTRISHTSTATTTATNPSRTNSMTSSPPSNQLRDRLDGDTKLPYRSLSSYSLAKRRSAVPIALKEVPMLNSPEGLLQHHKGLVAASTVDASRTPSVAEHVPSYKGPAMAQSVPNLRARLDRHDSKVASPTSSNRGRPDSYLGELPDATKWATKISPGSHRSSFAQHSPAHERPSPLTAPSNSRNPSSQSFSLPLRVNTIESARRVSPNVEEETDILSPIPAVHVLNAKVDSSERTTIDSANIPVRASSIESRRASSRLSLFPDPSPPQPVTASATLHRPSSMQIRKAEQAAFLSSSRSYPSQRTVSQPRSTTTVPIRSLKPSRSLQCIPQEHAPTRNFSRQGSHSVTDDEDRATPLAERRPSTASIASHTRTSMLGAGDFSVPLGPPAPPPSTPLPKLPPLGARSRSKSPMPRYIGVAIGDHRSQSAMSMRELRPLDEATEC